MNDNARRPFYAEYAWAFNLLIDRPVRKECATMVAWLVERGVLPGAELLDAGCGTGRYSAKLARRGYLVHGIDLSAELIAEARRSIVHSTPGHGVLLGRKHFNQLPVSFNTTRFSAAASSTTLSTKRIATPCSPCSQRRFDREAC